MTEKHTVSKDENGRFGYVRLYYIMLVEVVLC